MGDTTENTTETFLLRLGGGGGIVASTHRAAPQGWSDNRRGQVEGTCDTVAKANTPPAGYEF